MSDPTGKVFDLALLPPRVQLNLWTLAMHADTDAVQLTYKPGAFVTKLKYNYGGTIDLLLDNSRTSLMLSVDPTQAQPGATLVFKGFDFNAVAKLAPSSVGLSLSYGAARLPTPAMLTPVFDSAWQAAGRTWGDIGAAPDDPLKFLRLHKNDTKAIGDAVKAAQKVGPIDPKKSYFGAGVTFDYRGKGAPGPAPQGFNATLWLQGTF